MRQERRLVRELRARSGRSRPRSGKTVRPWECPVVEERVARPLGLRWCSHHGGSRRLLACAPRCRSNAQVIAPCCAVADQTSGQCGGVAGSAGQGFPADTVEAVMLWRP